MNNNIDISKLLNLTDAELRTKIVAAAGAAGADPKKVQGALQDTDKLRKMISTLTDKDIQNLIQTVGKEKAEEIAKHLNTK